MMTRVRTVAAWRAKGDLERAERFYRELQNADS